jgi:hypothetical protein
MSWLAMALAVCWSTVAAMALAFCRASARAPDARVEREAGELWMALRSLERVQGPSGQPFFATPAEERRLERALVRTAFPALRTRSRQAA